MAKLRALVTPSLLVWARETAGYSLQAAAERMQVDQSRVLDWEAGVEHPTISQAKSLAELYKRPLSVFYLPAPPLTTEPPPDYRRLSVAVGGISPAARYEIRRARYRRDVALELLEASDDLPEPFGMRIGPNEAPEVAAARIREALRISIEQQFAWRSERDALRDWIAAVEGLGVMVFQTAGGRWGLAPEEMWGASLYYEILPVILLTGRLSVHARIFSLVHEFCHLALQSSGICDTDGHQSIEVYCNAVAGNVLVPTDAVADGVPSHWSERDIRDEWIQARADQFQVSREVLVRRLLAVGRVSPSFYELKREQYRQEYLRSREASKGDDREMKLQWRYMVLRSNGPRYTGLVLDAYNEGLIGLSAVSRYLDMNLKHLKGVQQRMLEIARAR